jgi:crotonobetainyl-CoA:carnitine CoA-transferase CaiB-like acyl-CoA transferase
LVESEIVDAARPLTGVRVIDMATASADMCGRYLADLGADTIRVEPPGGGASRRKPPFHGELSLHHATHNAGKRSVVLDFEQASDRARLAALLESADIWIESIGQDALHRHGFGATQELEHRPHLVIVSLSEFGLTGPYAGWAGTDATHLAMAGALARSGLPDRPPLLPPGDVASEVTSMQAAWAALLGFWNRLETGLGDHIDFSIFEATAQVVDPGLGTSGTALVAGLDETRGRPVPGLYPIFPCKDGHVRLCVLGPRQWHAMRAWLDEPEEFQDAEYDSIIGRKLAEARLNPLYAELFRDRGKFELSEEGQRRGVPMAPVLTLGEVLETEHFRARGAIARTELAAGVTADVPTGFVEIGHTRVGPSRRAPALNEHYEEIVSEPIVTSEPFAPFPAAPPDGGFRRPLEGLRVLDLGVIVMGAEVAKLFADAGAEVIKIENRAFPDGARVSPNFAIGHRNEKGLGVNLRTPRGVELFKQLAARSDVVLANFKPGTMERLGLGYEALRELNPAIVVVHSSAVGATGPWSDWMGYGPLVRCSAGLTSLWRYPDDATSFCDGTTIHPDHFSARIAGVAALATLIARRRTGQGAHIQLSQAEALLVQLSSQLTDESLHPGANRPLGNANRFQTPWGVYRCAGDDEWVVITVRDDHEWHRLRRAIGDPEWAAAPEFAVVNERIKYREEIDRRLGEWTCLHGPRDAAALLQAGGVPAGFMQRTAEYEHDPHLRERHFFREFVQPGLPPRTVEHTPFWSRRMPVPDARPAPAVGEHTREICESILGMAKSEIDALFKEGTLESDVPVTEHLVAAQVRRPGASAVKR